MGAEANCTATIDGVSHTGRALLETSEIVFRGTSAKRLVIPFASITDVSARDGVLVVQHAKGEARFELGGAAATWLAKIRAPKSRVEKLGAKPGMRVVLLGVKDAAFIAELRARGVVVAAKVARDVAMVFVQAERADDLEQLVALRKTIASDAAVWVIRPKGVKAITEAQVRAGGLAAGFVDVKVVGFSPTHTAEKFVVRLRDR